VQHRREAEQTFFWFFFSKKELLPKNNWNPPRGGIWFHAIEQIGR
jgi:hypothetical protein